MFTCPNRVNILVLDDDKLVVKVLLDLFSKDYCVESAVSIAEFEEKLLTFKPEIMLIDVVLPDGDGISLCQNIRSRNEFNEVFIIMLTAASDSSHIETAYRNGANDYIRKPFIPFEVSSKISLLAKNLEYKKTVIGLYERQKDINNKLFKMTSLINTNINLSSKYGMLTSLFQITAFVDTSYIEVIFFGDNDSVYSNKKIIREGFNFAEYEKIKSKLSIFSDAKKIKQRIKIKNQAGELIYCNVVSLFYNKQHAGYIILENSTPMPKESEDLLSLYLDFVNIKGTDIYAQDQLKDEIKKDRKELAKVRTLQVALLPQFQEIDRYDIASSFIPMEDISGDFFDGFYIREGVYQVVICDVAGHGVASSYVGSSIRGIIRSIAKEIFDVEHQINYINKSIMQSMKEIYYFSSLVLCQLNISDGTVTYASAGHPPCVFYDNSVNKVFRIDNTGPLLGLSDKSEYETKRIVIKEGDCFFIYTDGLTEAQNGKKEFFGTKRLIDSFAKCAHENSIDIVHSILGTVYEFTEYNNLQDDVSLICLKRKY